MLDLLIGVQPELRRVVSDTTDALSAAAIGDMVIVATPATLGSSAAAVNAAIAADGQFDRTVVVTLETAAGAIHNWFNGTFAIAGSEVTAGDGTADTTALTVTVVNGVGTCVLRYIGAWAAADTATLTVTGDTIFGAVVANATSVDTLIA